MRRLVSLASRSELLRLQLLYLVAVLVLVPFAILYALLVGRGTNHDLSLGIAAILGAISARLVWARVSAYLARQTRGQWSSSAFSLLVFDAGPFGFQIPQPMALAAAWTVFVSIGHRPIIVSENRFSAGNVQVVEVTA